jgi:hypothetical protein
MMENHSCSQIVNNPNARRQRVGQIGERRHELPRYRSSQPDQLPGGCWRLECRRAQRQQSGLEQPDV